MHHQVQQFLQGSVQRLKLMLDTVNRPVRILVARANVVADLDDCGEVEDEASDGGDRRHNTHGWLRGWKEETSRRSSRWIARMSCARPPATRSCAALHMLACIKHF